MPWFDRFLTRLARGEPATLFHPAMVSDQMDGKIAHLDRLNFSCAWCWRMLATSWKLDDARRAPTEVAAATHLAAGLLHSAKNYTGEHWLANFAVLALDE